MSAAGSGFAHGPANRSMPEATVIPVLHYSDVRRAAAWLCGAFGFRERLRIGTHRIQMLAGGGAVVAADGPMPATGAGNAHSVMVRVGEVDAHCERARAAGARVVAEPQSYPFGERQYTVLDLEGHAWTFSQSERDVDPRDWGGEPVG